MKCLSCRFENPEGKKFCRECGAKLVLSCTHCGSEILPNDKFCGECGVDLKTIEETPPAEDSEARPPATAALPDNILTSPGRTGERKHVTVLFSDLNGYTAMSERLDPEEVKEITTRIFDKISKIVSKYDGFVEKFAGDAVMALFGADQAHEDDPVRAIKAAMEIHSLVTSLSPQLEQSIEQPLSMHTGINTGLVVTGEINFEKGTHGVSGDAINVAARLSGIGEPDDILVGQNTFHQAAGFFDFHELEPVRIKGKKLPVKVYKVLSSKEKPTKIHRHHGVRAELIGRKAEMGQLASALKKLTENKIGSVVLICGTAGTGKSRIVEEFRSSLKLENISWLEGHAYQYSQNTPYYPIIDLLKKALEIDEGDSPETVKKKIETGVFGVISENRNFIPYIGSLFSISYPEIEKASPEFLRKQLHEAFRSILVSLSQSSQTVVCFEDLHWADHSFLELIRKILPEFKNPILFICTHRPVISLFTSHQTDSMSIPYHEIRLQDLSPSESQLMVESLLMTDSIPSELQRFVHEKIEGNPFYIEEVINSLIESGALFLEDDRWKVKRKISKGDISSTIHGVISGRIDRLGDETKRILQEASVIGRVFLFDILRRITTIKKDIDGFIKSLEQLDLIRVKSFHPDLEYIFKHALTQEVVYNGLIKKDRQLIHQQTGLVIENIFANRLPEFYEILAHHFRESNDSHRAVHYLSMSGEKSFRKSSINEAQQYFKESFDILSSRPDKTNEEEHFLIDLLIKWTLVLRWSGEFQIMADLFKGHLNIAEALDDKEQLGKFYACYGFALGWIGKPNDSYRYLRKAFKLCEQTSNYEFLCYSCAWLAFTCSELGFIEESKFFEERGQELLIKLDSDIVLYAETMVYLVKAYIARGEVNRAKIMGRKILDRGKECLDSRLTSSGHYLLGISYFTAGDFNSAIEVLNQATLTTKDPTLIHSIKLYLGWAYFSNEQLVEAENVLKELNKLTEKLGSYMYSLYTDVGFALILLSKGNFKKGLNILKNCQDFYLKNGYRFNYAIIEYLLGRFYLQLFQRKGSMNFLSIAKNIGFLLKNIPVADKKAEEKFNRAIEISQQIGANGLIGQTNLYLGLLYKEKKRTSLANRCISESIKIFDLCGAETYLQQAKVALESLQ